MEDLENELQNCHKKLQTKDEVISKLQREHDMIKNQVEDLKAQKMQLINRNKMLEEENRRQKKQKMGVSSGSKFQEEQQCEDKFKKMLKQLQLTGDRFTDTEFVPGPMSLIKDWNDKAKQVREIVEEWKEFKWIRADQIPSFNTGDENDKLAVFKGLIEPADILQGRIDDSYLLSALAAISESPKRIQRMFVTDQVNREGLFGVFVY